jgi:hypothetical protein
MSTEVSTELKGHFIRLFRMALTDDDFSPLELKMLYHFAAERNVPQEELDKALLGTVGALSIPEDLDQRVEYLYDLGRMIWADGKVTEDEIYLLKKYCRQFQFEEENIDELSAYLIERVKAGVSKQELLAEIKAS